MLLWTFYRLSTSHFGPTQNNKKIFKEFFETFDILEIAFFNKIVVIAG